jgi:Putative phage abortive infection protein
MRYEESKSKTETHPFENAVFWAGSALIVIVLASICIYVYRFHDFPWGSDPGSWGQFGDFLGGLLNPLVASVALLVLVASYSLQKRELADTRAELKLQREQLEHANKLAQQQALEATLFHLISSWKETVASLWNVYTQSKGQAAVADLVNQAWNHIDHERYQGMVLLLELPDSEREIAVDKFFAAKESVFGHYTRQMGYLLVFIHERLAQPSLYIQILLSQLSSDDVRVLCYYGASERGKKIRELISRYEIPAVLPDSEQKLFSSVYQIGE